MLLAEGHCSGRQAVSASRLSASSSASNRLLPACLPSSSHAWVGRSEAGRDRRGATTTTRSLNEDNAQSGQETRLGKNVLSGIKELRDNIKWSSATITRNE